MKAVKYRRLKIRTFLAVIFLTLSIFIATKKSELSSEGHFSKIIPMFFYVFKNSIALAIMLAFAALTIRVVVLFFTKNKLNFRSIQRNKSIVINLFLIFTILFIFSKGLSENFTKMFALVISSNVYEQLYVFEITMLAICLVLSIISIILLKRISGDKIVFNQEIIIDQFLAEIDALHKNYVGIEFELRENEEVFENKVKLFISKTNKQRIMIHSVKESDELAVDKKAKMPPTFLF
ncbi:hypothetical protein SCHIN_v1c02510 [Spiroplasma chinense]|uniref:Transmembrane protein n=1 Tax=Spiroplasma chinense TaxID=216932 RepID=A0A5B9Y2Z5_9MOLU|nr:hypothetical protein [Spiroplasma chinense]QEH61448.1 hypothetical protein SCHIN_v1c02510 [Spiroplasma chinense]